ncbi:MAG TPA: hypothetical protein VN239_09310 [Nitrososphaera sp.]|jgi:hypothetical protein|nr:hypothetical protein [Nitrososphaera sp.]
MDVAEAALNIGKDVISGDTAPAVTGINIVELRKKHPQKRHS